MRHSHRLVTTAGAAGGMPHLAGGHRRLDVVEPVAARPARSKFTFGCDCIVEAKSSLLWGRFEGAFRYSVAGSSIILERKQPTEIRFTREGDSLLMVWPDGDRESLTLARRIECAAGR
jgi:hypothetical protein